MSDFNPEEEYATRIKNFLTEYPEGSQILREILQNTDDAQSSEQVFILDHNTYPSEKLFDPNLRRFQGPTLLSVNNSIFQEDGFKSLLSLANSGKMDKYDKIGGKIIHPDQFEPFSVALNNPLEGYYEGTIFRYPLRTDKDVADSKISAKKYSIEQVRKMFDIFFEVDNITCLLFLKYIEKISFYEIKKGGRPKRRHIT
ncbi:hypothetical protein F8M41_003391 [Gigaspora margarita]|uniref:Sacsin/Nov domain-containing protein n=1 Tax=Gigaspora margarita TaxID=4874 RepID=A0A8H4B4S1_GIGMA|nr:hypothetical protein F8M41_003391 [Gigaspora margarita]